jgi:hypothetical protein
MVATVTAPVTPTRSIQPSRLRRLSEIVLITGTVLAAAAASGPIWSVRLGVAIAIVAADLACIFAWRELYAAKRAHAQALLAATREHGAALKEERTRNAAVVDTLSVRVADAGRVIDRQRRTIAEERIQIADLKGDQDFLKGEVAYRDTMISELREAVRGREMELVALQHERDGEVRRMPARVLAEEESVWDELAASEDAITEELPAVVDLKVVDTVLPNYEHDRQSA